MGMSCPACTTRMCVVHSQSFDNTTQRWYRCPECGEGLRTCETIHLGGAKRNPRGSAHPNAVLTEENVRALRDAHERGVSLNQLATEYGLNRSTVIDIIKRRSWTHVA